MSDYFAKRNLRDKAASVNRTEEYIQKKQKQYYIKASKQIREEIEKLYQQFADKEQISLADAKQQIRAADFEKIDWDGMMEQMKEYLAKKDMPQEMQKQLKKQNDLLEEQIKRYSAKGHISYLELKDMEINQILVNLYDEQQISMYEYLQSEWDDGYYRSRYNIEQYIGYGYDYVKPNERAVNQAILTGYDKCSFSKRLYNHCSHFSEDVKENLVTGLIRGESIDKMAARISRRLDVAYSRARTLVRTETAYIYEQAGKQAYEDCGVEWYEYFARLDNKTSFMCQELDGKHYRVKDAVPGVNYPPMHPNCRSTTVCFFPEEEKKKTTRLAKSDSGKYYEVPADMTYKEWRKSKEEREKLNEEEKYALNQYMGFQSYLVNERLRENKKLTTREEKFVKDLDSALDKLDNYTGNVVRCLQIPSGEALETFLKTHQKGETVCYKEYTSCSNSDGYNPEANVIIYRESTHGKDMTSFNPQEKEVLYKRNSRFYVTKFVEKDGVYYLKEVEL